MSATGMTELGCHWNDGGYYWNDITGRRSDLIVRWFSEFTVTGWIKALNFACGSLRVH